MNKMNGFVKDVVSWLKRWNFRIVLLLSVFHVGLAYIHDRDSG
jgi:hypothetical protein